VVVVTFVSSSKSSEEIITEKRSQEETGFLCKGRYLPYSTEYLGDAYVGKLSEYSSTYQQGNHEVCQISSPELRR
jgi:hypothetical protein